MMRASDCLTRRDVLKALGVGFVGLFSASCGSRSNPPAALNDAPDFSARFAAFQPADEPNGDLSKVVWPSFVTRAGPEVQTLYEFQIQNGELMKYMPCFCGCGQQGHRNNRDCYVKQVNPDGSIEFDAMAPT